MLRTIQNLKAKVFGPVLAPYKLKELKWHSGMTLSPEQVHFWNNNGFLILTNFFSQDELDPVQKELDQMWRASRDSKIDMTVDCNLGPDVKRKILSDVTEHEWQKPHKVNDLYLFSESVRQIVAGKKLGSVVFDLLNGAPVVCNSLNFHYGSEQPFHTDSLYMTPPKELNLAATWIALEDCSPEAGPLQYYPGSHKIQPYLFSNGRMSAQHDEMPSYDAYMQEQCTRYGLKIEKFCPKAGDVLIWHSQLYHGGSKINNKSLTRRSLVTHYFKDEDTNFEKLPISDSRSFYNVRPPT